MVPSRYHVPVPSDPISLVPALPHLRQASVSLILNLSRYAPKVYSPWFWLARGRVQGLASWSTRAAIRLCPCRSASEGSWSSWQDQRGLLGDGPVAADSPPPCHLPPANSNRI